MALYDGRLLIGGGESVKPMIRIRSPVLWVGLGLIVLAGAMLIFTSRGAGPGPSQSAFVPEPTKDTEEIPVDEQVTPTSVKQQLPPTLLTYDKLKRGKLLPGKVVVSCPWGDQPGECAILYEGLVSAPVYGPESFVVDGTGSIYILDTQNSRIQKFNENGRYLDSMPVAGWGVDIDLDDENSLYILNIFSQAIVKYGSQKQEVAKYSYEYMGSLLIRGLLVRNDDIFLVTDEIMTIPTVASGQALPVDKQRKMAQERVLTKRKDLWIRALDTDKDGNNDTVKGISKDGDVLFKACFIPSEIETDAAGNIFVVYDALHVIMIAILSPQGDILGQLSVLVPGDSFDIQSPNRWFRSDSEGNVYLMFLRETGLEIVKWEFEDITS